MKTRIFAYTSNFLQCRLPLCLAVVLAIGAVFCAPPRAEGYFQHQFQAEKIVRLWFDFQDGVQVERMLSGMRSTEIRHVFQFVERHPFVLEVRDGQHGAWRLQLYHNLRRTFEDALQYN